MTQQSLFQTYPFIKHRETSKEAAESITDEAATTWRERVYSVIKSTGGATDEEIQTALAMNPSTQRPRRVELLYGDRIKDSGEKRNTKSGRKATVWVTK